MSDNDFRKDPARQRWVLRFGPVESFILIFLLVAGVGLFIEYNLSMATAHKQAERLFLQSTRNVQIELRHIDDAVTVILHSARTYHDAGLLNPENVQSANALFTSHMNQYPFVTSINSGDSSGNGYLILRSDRQIKNRVKRADEKEWVTWFILGENGEIVATERFKDDYDPRTRPWYQNSVNRKEIIWSAPYKFRTTGDIGISASLWLNNRKGNDEVVGVDIMLKDLSQLLAGLTAEKGMKAHLIAEDGTMVICSETALILPRLQQKDTSLPRVGLSAFPFVESALEARTKEGNFWSFTSGGKRFFALMEPVSFTPNGKFNLMLTVPEETFVGNFAQEALWRLGIALLLLVVASIWYIDRYLLPLRRIATALKEFGLGNFRILSVDVSRKDEIGDLASEFIQMTDALTEKEEFLRESEARYRNLIMHSPDAIFVNQQDRVILVNHACMRLFGASSEVDLIGKSPFDLFHPDFHPQIRARIHRLRELDEAVQLVEEKIVRLDGGIVDVEVLAAPFVSGGTNAIHVILRDITERKRAEEALLENTKRMTVILDGINALIYVADLETYEILFVNKYGRDIWGEITGKTCWKTLQDGQSGPCAFCTNDRLLTANGVPTGVYAWESQNSLTGCWYERRDQVIRWSDGRLVRMEIATDITECRKMEAQLHHAQKMESIGTFAGGIAHDFNNILTAIIGYGTLALMKMAADDPQRLYIQNMLEASDRAAHLTKDLLLFSRKQAVNRKPVDLNMVVAKVEKFLKRVIGEDIECKTILQKAPLPVLADDYQLEQVLMNLATNARDVMPHGGVLTVTTGTIVLNGAFVSAHGFGKPGSYALITVSDTGMGMDEATRLRIFEPFFTTKEVGRGTGLGLAVTYGIIKQHDGYINVYSEPGTGTTFRIYLPVIPAEAGEERLAQQEETSVGGTETILLAEDDKYVRDMIRSVLSESGYTVIAAVDGADAVSKFAEYNETIDLLIFDLIMPKMNGKEAFDEIQKVRLGIKVIFSSGYAPETIRQKVSLADGVHLISKPILPKALLRKVRSVLDEVEAK